MTESSKTVSRRPGSPRQARAKALVGNGSGFSLVEMLVVMLILVTLAAFGFPALQELFNRSKLQGSAREIAVHLGSSRIAAMRLGRNVVVKPVFDRKQLIAFVDENEDLVQDPGEAVISTLGVPGTGSGKTLYLMGPDGVAGTDEAPAQALEGLTFKPGADVDDPGVHAAVFEPDGSVRQAGGFRISDGKSPGNVFEVRIDPSATARIEILKYVYGDNRGIHPSADPAGSWYGQGGNMWVWY